MKTLHSQHLFNGLAFLLAMILPPMALAAGPAPVVLGEAAHFTILSYAGITTTGGGKVTGDAGNCPTAGSYIGLTLAQMVGTSTIYAVDDTGPTGSVRAPVMLTTAKGDLGTAYTDAAGRTVPAPVLNLNGGNMGGQTLVPGLYKFDATAQITGEDVTLNGGPNDVWIFQIGADLQLGSYRQVLLTGGAQAKNIFWQVGSNAVLGTYSVFKGTIMAYAGITIMNGATMEGRALSKNESVIFDGLSISIPTSTLTVVNGTGSGSYAPGKVVAISAIVPIGKLFDAWTGDILNVADATAAATIVTMPVTDVTVTATFIDAPPATYTLTVVNGTGGNSYPAGTLVPVTAIIPPGKVFDAWTGDIGSLADPAAAATIDTMPALNNTITATFKDAPPATYTLTVVNGTGGGAYAATTIVPVIATVPAGKVFDAWTGDIGFLADPTAAATSATMPAFNITITALFKNAPPATYTLTVVNGTGGGAYAATTVVPVIATVPAGKVFDAWTGNIGALADPAAAATSATMPAANITVTALFKDAPPATYTLTVVNGTGGGAYAATTVVPVIAVVPAGTVFKQWVGNSSALANPAAASTNATMPAANITVTAVFNHPPVAVDDAYVTAENTTLNVPAPGVLINDIDVDGDTLTAIQVTAPAHGTLTLNANGSLTYVPSRNYHGTDSFTYKANDGNSDSNTATVTLTVNAAPVVESIVSTAFTGTVTVVTNWVDFSNLDADDTNCNDWRSFPVKYNAYLVLCYGEILCPICPVPITDAWLWLVNKKSKQVFVASLEDGGITDAQGYCFGGSNVGVTFTTFLPYADLERLTGSSFTTSPAMVFALAGTRDKFSSKAAANILKLDGGATLAAVSAQDNPDPLSGLECEDASELAFVTASFKKSGTKVKPDPYCPECATPCYTVYAAQAAVVAKATKKYFWWHILGEGIVELN
jgi:VCBS repeat-containing protein